MGETIEDLYEEDEFAGLLEDARMNASSDWDESFVASMKERFDKYGRSMYISESQSKQIARIAGVE